MKVTLTEEQTRHIPGEFVYNVPLPGPDPWKMELAARVYPDREYPRWVPDNKPVRYEPKVERRAELEVRARPIMASDDPKEVMAKHGVIEVVALPGKYTLAKRERVLGSRNINLSLLHGPWRDLARDMVHGVVKGVPYA